MNASFSTAMSLSKPPIRRNTRFKAIAHTKGLFLSRLFGGTHVCSRLRISRVFLSRLFGGTPYGIPDKFSHVFLSRLFGGTLVGNVMAFPYIFLSRLFGGTPL